MPYSAHTDILEGAALDLAAELGLKNVRFIVDVSTTYEDVRISVLKHEEAKIFKKID